MNKNEKNTDVKKRWHSKLVDAIFSPRHGRGGKRRDFNCFETRPKKIHSQPIIKRLFAYVSDYKFGIITIFVLSIISAVIGTISPKISGSIITKLSEGALLKNSGVNSGIDFGGIFKILALLFALYSILALTSCICSYIITEISIKITYRLREDISKKISVLPINYLESKNCGEILSHITNDVEVLSSSLTGSISQIISSIIMFLGTIYMMFSISWQMSLVSIGILPVAAVFISVIASKAQKLFKKFQDDLGFINGHIEEMYSGHEIVKSFSMEKISIDKFEGFNKNMYDSSWKSEFLSGLMSPVMSIISNINYIVVCVMGGYLASLRFISIGDISAFIAYSGQFISPLMQIANISSIIQQTIASAQRIFDFLDAAEEKNVTADITPKRLISRALPSPEAKREYAEFACLGGDSCISQISFNPSIIFKNVNFGYSENNLVIKDFSLEIPSGKTVAIVGHTGAGKSTIIKILLNFYSVNSGEILIDNNNIYNYSNKSLRSMFGAVLQDTWLYSGSILENIRYANQAATDGQIINVCKITGTDHFISTLPNGYSTILNESSGNISCGQKQLISIARALISNPKILILDEATSSVDTATEKHIQKAIKHILKNRTSIIIAHRLSTIKDADLVAVMDKGEIIEKGAHDELLKNKSHYYNLYMNQFAKSI
ncbi:MAG: ABC transporter ATP-binding protein/permease [Oscillospiraceae bacterium]|jgi:ATP-binding cassette subfamily B protein|nr:ABC transporter ATP-binding protein/permease [Oscillospiraceae bacterium]